MNDWPVAGFTSTGSKRPGALYGDALDDTLPLLLTRSAGCSVWDAAGREYLDCIMALGAVALGYAHPDVNTAAISALEQGMVGPLAPELESLLASDLRQLMPWIEQARFHKTGAEACAAAVRLARVHTGRPQVLGCGYHGWLDLDLSGTIPFNDPEGTRRAIRGAAPQLAAVIMEPVIEEAPAREWLDLVRSETERAGALLILDEIKTAGRMAIGGATERYHLAPDLVVLGKAIANGFPLAVVGGRREVMGRVAETWISSTLSTEWMSLAAARATIGVMQRQEVPAHLNRVGRRLLDGFRRLAGAHSQVAPAAAGIPEMCFLRFRDEAASGVVAAGMARRGVIFKRSAYNFVSLAHDEASVDRVLEALDDTLRHVR